MSEDLVQQFQILKTELSEHLIKSLSNYKDLAEFQFDRELLADLAAFSTRGKMLRGVGFLLLAEQFGLKNRSVALTIAAGLELFQSALLIHDDIMDHDEKRRGQVSIFKLYQDKAAQQALKNSADFGIGTAICLGDMAYFLAYDLFLNAELPASVKQAILQLTNRELIQLGMSQVQDSYLAATPQPVTDQQILQMYVGKTARYTWRWPLLLAATATQQSDQVKATLEKISDTAGLLFQLKDDELGLFGSEEQTGKGVGSDVREGKKTLYWHKLQELAQQDSSLDEVSKLFGAKKVALTELELLQQKLRELGIVAEVEQQMTSLYHQAHQQIAELPDPGVKVVLSTLLDLTYYRKK